MVLATSSPSVCLAGRKRPRTRPRLSRLGRRPWDSNWPMQPRRVVVPYCNKSILDVVYEEEEEGEGEEKVDVAAKERRMMDVRTVVIGCGTTEMKVG